jgi:hypothetical protein
MKDSDAMQVLQWYELLEEELLDIIKDLPPADQNLKAFSPRLATVITESCGLLDSVFRQISPDPATVNGATKPAGKLVMRDYATLYAAEFELPSSRTILLTTPPRYLTPFAAWATLLSRGRYIRPPWWGTHTKLKHDRIAHIKKAQLEIAIQSLCALHMIISRVPEFAKMILRNNWVFCSGYNPEGVIEVLQGTAKDEWLSFLVESKLFIFARGAQKFPAKIDDFKPSMFKASEKIANFFGRWY